MGHRILISALLATLVFAAGCTTQQSTSGNNTTNVTTSTPETTTPNTTTTPATVTPSTPATTTPSTPAGGGSSNATSDLVFVATQSGPPGNGTTYNLSGPYTASAGWVKITLRNRGLEPHQAVVYALGNLTYAQFHDMLVAPPSNSTNQSGPEPKSMGGPGVALPGGNTTAWIDLPKGNYVVACFVTDPSGAPHAMHGMTTPLSVVAGGGEPAKPPTADVNVTLVDYKFQVSPNITAGHHVLAIRNSGNHVHEAPYVKLTGNATLADFIAAVSPGSNATSIPASEGGGGGAIEPGAVEYVEANFTAGTYGFLCFEQDTPTSPPHFTLGMQLEVKVS